MNWVTVKNPGNHGERKEKSNRIGGIARRIRTLPAWCAALLGGISASADDAPDARAAAERMQRGGAAWLISSQAADGAWAPQSGPGVTALALKALIRAPGVGPEHASVRRGLEYLRQFHRADGGIYGGEGLVKNYETSVALSMYACLPGEGYADLVSSSQKFLIDLQWDESEDRSRDDPFYGGAGYGQGRRPDLSNTQIMLDALHDSGLPEDHPAYERALVFIQRCQMLGEVNDQSFAAGSTQGGFIYSPANNGESKAGTITRDGRSELASYGSMTYAGLKSMVYAGLTRDDPRVRAAFEWIRRNWTLKVNPGMPPAASQQGLYYYFHTFARTMRAWGEHSIRDATGRERAWRDELVAELRTLQRQDGSWKNDADRWMEGMPELSTAYALLALQEAFPE